MSTTDIAPLPNALPARFREAADHLDGGRNDEALIVCEQILADQPNCPEAIMLLGLISYELDEPFQAIELLKRAHETAPDISDYADALASIHARLGDTTEALFLTKLATALNPHPSGEKILPRKFSNFFENLEAATPNKFRNRAANLLAAGDYASAENAATMQLQLTPADPETLRIIARIYRSTGQVSRAISALHAVIHTSPETADRLELSKTLSDAGRHSEAAFVGVLACREAPSDAMVAQNLLMALERNPDISESVIEAEKLSWNTRFTATDADQKSAFAERTGVPGVDRPLSIAFVGNRFSDVETSHMLAPVFAALNQRGCHLYIYTDEDRETALTYQLNRYTKRWTNLKGVDPETAATIIRGDKIDIAIDISGHAANSRITTFAWRPAPVTISWCGSLLPTRGLFDYLLTGPLPFTEDQQQETGAETQWSLPATPLIYPQPSRQDGPAPLPALGSGQVTFGTSMPLSAVGEATLLLWSDVLSAVPNSRLFIANTTNLDDECVERTYELLSHIGLRQRTGIIDLGDGPDGHLEFLNHVDIAIDPQPASSFSKTSQALWAGVPVIAIAGQRFSSHAGASALLAADRREWVVSDSHMAAQLASRLASDLPALSEIRATLAETVSQSALADTAKFADALIAAFAKMLEDERLAA